MASVLVQIADAIITELQAGTFTRDINPIRSYAEWSMELEDADTLHVDVVPVTMATELGDRNSLQYLCEVDVGIRQRFSQAGTDERDGRILNTAIDPLVELAEQIGELLSDPAERRLTDYTTATWEATNVLAPYYRDHLREMRQFTSVVRLTYRAFVDL